MGSLFYINVPTREYEVILRQRSLQIKVEKEIDNVNQDLLASQLQLPDIRIVKEKRESVGKGPRTSTTAGSDNQTAGHGTGVAYGNQANRASITSTYSGGMSDSVVDVYEALVNGEKTNIVVTQDSMVIYPRAVPTLDDDKQVKLSPTVATQLKKETKENMFLEKHLEDTLSAFLIYDATWGQSVDGNFSQISFTVQDFRTEDIINSLVSLGIGTKYDSTLTVCAATIYYNPNKQEARRRADAGEESKDSFGSQFIASIKSRLTVAQVVQTVQANAVITFDFILLLLIAASIAALGLLDNSSVSLVASMLISPLMGPIMAGCFGTVVRDKKLLKTGVVSELIGLFLCLVVGFVFGVCVTAAPFDGPWARVKHWPTDEMIGRGHIRSIAVGAMVAIPSGAGVALSILAGNAGSLVGVAISASLLPPAVNCGMFLGMSAVITIKEQLAGHNPYGTPCGQYIGDSDATATDHSYRLTRENYDVPDFYCKNVVMEYAIVGIISFGLTMVNIVLILISGFLILKLKEVAPHTTRKTMNRFWKEDLKVMRDYNKTHGSFNKQDILAEIGGTHNAAVIRAKLVNDSVFNQVARRNVFGTQIGAQELLESQVFSSSETIQTTDSLEANTKPKSGGWFSGWFGGGADAHGSEATMKPSTVSNRPHLKHF